MNPVNNTRNSKIISQECEKGLPITIAAVSTNPGRNAYATTRTRLLKRISLGGIVLILAALGSFGCQSSENQAIPGELAKSKSANASTTTPKWPRKVTIPSGTTLFVSLNTTLRTDREMSGDGFVARLYSAVCVDEMTVLPVGTEVRGRLIFVGEPYHTLDIARMTLVFERLVDPSGRIHSISTSPIFVVGDGDKASDEESVTTGAFGGVIGALVRKKQSARNGATAAIAGVAGGGAIVVATTGRQIELPSDQHFDVDLVEPLRLSVIQLSASR